QDPMRAEQRDQLPRQREKRADVDESERAQEDEAREPVAGPLRRQRRVHDPRVSSFLTSCRGRDLSDGGGRSCQVAMWPPGTERRGLPSCDVVRRRRGGSCQVVAAKGTVLTSCHVASKGAAKGTVLTSCHVASKDGGDGPAILSGRTADGGDLVESLSCVAA